jgi:hypothetical protein
VVSVVRHVEHFVAEEELIAARPGHGIHRVDSLQINFDVVHCEQG